MKNFLNYLEENKEYNLSEVYRYNGKNKIKMENVAEHSFYVALNVIKIGNWFNIDTKIIKDAIALAVVHDIPEYLVGDIPYEFKQDNPNIIEQFAVKEHEAMVVEYSDNNPLLLELFDEYLFQKDSVTFKLVDFADNVCARQFSYREIMLGNCMEDIVTIYKMSKERSEKYYQEFSDIFGDKNYKEETK